MDSDGHRGFKKVSQKWKVRGWVGQQIQIIRSNEPPSNIISDVGTKYFSPESQETGCKDFSSCLAIYYALPSHPALPPHSIVDLKNVWVVVVFLQQCKNATMQSISACLRSISIYQSEEMGVRHLDVLV
eukprot:scaffold27051_cov113-Skeletonema_menzelii.AAC.4